MIQALVLDTATVNKAMVISNRTNSDEIGVIKAMMIENLKLKVSNGVAHFLFLKKDGTLREAWGTTKPELANAKTNGRGVSRELYNTTGYFDIEKGAWRSFRWESLVQIF